MALLTGAAHAQTSDTTTAPDDGEIVVTGFRASLAQSIDAKRKADAIIDSVSAEDVGKFPNTNVAEALTLVPGVTVDRAFGQGEKVSILGTDPALNRTLLNGQTVASADWFILDSPGRTFNYALLAPQLVNRVDVYKSPEPRIDEGLRVRRHGAGTFVAGRVEKQFAKLSSFSEDMASRGRTVRSEWLIRESGVVTGEESLTFGLSPGTAVYRFHRIRYADDVPMALEFAIIPGFGLPSLDMVDSSLYAALESTGNRPVRALQRLRAALCDAERAALLGVEVGAPVLYIERRGFLADGRVIEATTSWYRGDAYDFVAELDMRG
jgi:GntR family transcriptional regulator